jgi:hypothetical protein
MSCLLFVIKALHWCWHVPTARYRVVPRASVYVQAKYRCNWALLVSICCAKLNNYQKAL